MAFGDDLRRRREALDLTQEALALRAGVSRVHIQQLESGWSDRRKRSPANPKLGTLLALAAELGTRVVIDVVDARGLVIYFDDRSPR